jgi:hypothetical protein
MKAHIHLHNGTPTLFLDGKPTFANIHLLGTVLPAGLSATQESIRAFAKNGIHIYSIDAVSSEWRGPVPGVPSHFDFRETAPRLQQVLDADPDALFLLRMGFETRYLPGNWWNNLYPDEVEVLSDGQRISASYASQVWREQVQELLRAYIDHLRQVGLYDRVLAYQVAVGTCGEWIKDWSSMGSLCGDYSAPMLRAFRAWLKGRYGSDSALQRAWGRADARIATAEVPTCEEQMNSHRWLFRDPRQERNVADFYACYAETAADAMISLCRAVKEATAGEKLAGAFFGYIMELSWNNCFFNDNFMDREASEVSTVQRSGHLGLAKALRSPDVDFFVSPYGYAFRGVGGDCLPMQPTESLRHHGKLYLLEEDTLMHNNFDPGGRMHPVEHSIAIYQRNFAQVVTHGIGVTWLENDIFVESPKVLPEARECYRRFQELGTWMLHLDRRLQAETAVFLDDESFFYESNHNNIDLPLIWQQRVIALNRFGASHDVYLLNDLLEGGLPVYKLYVFLNPFHLDARRRRLLKDILETHGATALWLYAPGYQNVDAVGEAAGDSASTEWMSDLTGFRFGQGGSYWAPFMHLTDFNHPITRGIPQDLFWGTTRSLAPIFHLEDPDAAHHNPDAAILGEVVYGLGRCKPGLGVKQINSGNGRSWNSIYVATPNLPPQLLRGIARFAGVHLYSEDGDVLYATRELLGVHTVAGGKRTFRLPRKVEVVYDLFAGQEIARDAQAFEVELAPASTRLFYTGEAGLLKLLTGRGLQRAQIGLQSAKITR